MLFARRRYYFWLFRAYVKKWKRTISTSILAGIVAFFVIVSLITFYFIPTFLRISHKTGYTGIYTPDTIPEEILSNISYGLTQTDNRGNIVPAAAKRWTIAQGGTSYTFYLRKNLYFQNGEEFTTQTLNINFNDVKRKNIDKYTVNFQLKSSYAPFLAVVSKPLFIGNFVGLGRYKLKKLDINAGFIKSIALQDIKDSRYRNTIYFYPTQESLKLGFLLGDVDEINRVTSLTFQGKNISKWKNIGVKKNTNYNELVTLFYNNEDLYLSEKKLRQALNYALPDSFPAGLRAYSPLPPDSPFYVKDPNFSISSMQIAKAELNTIKELPKLPLTISTTEEFADTAKVVQSSWKKLGINSRIKIVEGVPGSFQIFLYKFRENKDPDQYSLWHSDGINNIARYKKNLRIDKLLEDGRQTTDTKLRTKIYADFQKYLLDDVPASFLYFPYEYTVRRK